MRDRKLPKRQYTEEFKVEAIRLAESVGGHEAARRLGVPGQRLVIGSGVERLEASLGPKTLRARLQCRHVAR